ncbi:MAG: hypothetical protein AB3A66_26990 [Nodularia sp. CChRGM 3473]
MPVAEKEKVDSWIQNPDKNPKRLQPAYSLSKSTNKKSKITLKNVVDRSHSRRRNEENNDQKLLFFKSPKARKYGQADRYRYRAVSRNVEMEATFTALVNQWRDENRGVSSTNQMSMHPAYQQIIGMGEAVIPLLLRELEKKSGHWFWALKSITREDPVPPEYRGKVKEMIKVWLEWGKNRGYKW